MTDHTPTVAVASIALTGAIDEYARAYPRGDFAAVAKAITARDAAVEYEALSRATVRRQERDRALKAEALREAIRDAKGAFDDFEITTGDPDDDDTWVDVTVAHWLAVRAACIETGEEP